MLNAIRATVWKLFEMGVKNDIYPENDNSVIIISPILP